jgi:hypothetical protein
MKVHEPAAAELTEREEIQNSAKFENDFLTRSSNPVLIRPGHNAITLAPAAARP